MSSLFRSFDDRMSESPPGAGELASLRKIQSQHNNVGSNYLLTWPTRKPGGQEAPPNPGNRGPTLF